MQTKRKHCSSAFIIKSLLLTVFDVFVGICLAAKNGRTLPRLTLLLPIQALHCMIVARPWQKTSLLLLCLNILLNVVGYVFLILLYRHSIQVIFNRKVPSYESNFDRPRAHPAIQSFNTHLLMLRPLEIIFRFLSAPLRVLPDVIVLGEVRCGTTNLCAHLSSLSRDYSGNCDTKVRCYAPFCPWAHPELDKKESFYFVGHYLGVVDPFFYRMAFPLIFTKWWEEYVMGNVFFTFDGCAQYLSSPSAPYLIANAYRRNNTQPPILVACIRNPVDQAISWWLYENNAMSWGESMGLKDWNTQLRSEKYPPKNISEALEYSQSSFVHNAYENAEYLAKTSSLRMFPSWALTWPGGQLSIFGKGYSRNIDRYNEVFKTEFGDPTSEIAQNKIGWVHVAPLELQETGIQLKTCLRPILVKVAKRCAAARNKSSTTLMCHIDLALEKVCASASSNNRRNSNPQPPDQLLLAVSDERKVLQEYYNKEITEMETKLGGSLSWK